MKKTKIKTCQLVNPNYEFRSIKEVDKFRLTVPVNSNVKIIYLITHKNSKSQYIGSSINIRVRLDNYCTVSGLNGIIDKNIYIAKAIKIHGLEAFSIQILVIDDISRNELQIMEQSYFDTYELEYNLRRQASGGFLPAGSSGIPVYIYLDQELLAFWPSRALAAAALACDRNTIKKYINSGSEFISIYILSDKPKSKEDNNLIPHLPHFVYIPQAVNSRNIGLYVKNIETSEVTFIKSQRIFFKKYGENGQLFKECINTSKPYKNVFISTIPFDALQCFVKDRMHTLDETSLVVSDQSLVL